MLLAIWLLAGILFDVLFVLDLLGLLKIVLFYPAQGDEQANANLSRILFLILPATTFLGLASCLAARRLLRRSSLVTARPAWLLALVLASSVYLWVSRLALRDAHTSLSFLVVAAGAQLVYLALLAGTAALIRTIRRHRDGEGGGGGGEEAQDETREAGHAHPTRRRAGR